MESPCPVCSAPIPPQPRSGRPRRTCSAECKRIFDAARKAQRTIDGHASMRCKHPGCTNLVPMGQRRFCSTECRQMFGQRSKSPNGFGDRCAVRFSPCPDCGATTTQHGKGRDVICKPCSRARRLAGYRRKNHNRRVSGSPIAVTVVDLAREDGAKCHLCGKRVDMRLSGHSPKGPTIDHLVPVSFGGTNDRINLALAHRECNVKRSNRGPAQLRLVA